MPDLVFFPKDKGGPGIILECKMAPTEKELEAKIKEAKEQIDNKQYISGFKLHKITEYRTYAIVYIDSIMQCRIQLTRKSPTQSNNLLNNISVITEKSPKKRPPRSR
jgi:hypothetical protein